MEKHIEKWRKSFRMVEDKGYWKDGYFYVENRVICGICAGDLGASDKKEGELSYDGCEEDYERW